MFYRYCIQLYIAPYDTFRSIYYLLLSRSEEVSEAERVPAMLPRFNAMLRLRLPQSSIGRCITTRSVGARRMLVSATDLEKTGPMKSIPSIDDAVNMPRHMSELSNPQLFLLAESIGHAGACRERMRREIMAVDNVEYSETSATLLAMANHIKGNHNYLKAPYLVGIYAALVSGWVSLPLVFHYQTASIFNDNFVTADPPEVGDADTWLEVRADHLDHLTPLRAPRSAQRSQPHAPCRPCRPCA